MPRTFIDPLIELATDHGGYVTTALAEQAGISRRALLGMVERGLLERVSRGVYRLRHAMPSRLAPFQEAVHWASSHRGPRCAISHDSALVVFGLTDANPSSVHLTIAKSSRFRREPPNRLIIHRADLSPDDVAEVDGLPVTTVPRTVVDLAEAGSLRFAREALTKARKEGHINGGEAAKLLVKIDDIVHAKTQ